ncbi:MAG: hypothetical protein ABSA78_22830 [Candidatus Sulfotelmatobacter sp.]|jgi:hypothetical protein
MEQDIHGSDATKSNLAYLLLGLILLGTSLYLSANIQNQNPMEVLILRVIIALGAAFAAVSLPGSVGVDLPKGIKAGGSLAIFVLIFFFNPADLIKPKPDIPLDDQKATEQSTSHKSLSSKGEDEKPAARPVRRQETIAPPVETKDKIAQASLLGDWKGTLTFPAQPGIAYPMALHASNSNNVITLTLDSEAQNYFGIPVEDLSVRESRATFVLTQTGQFPHASFDCHLQGEQLPCSVQQGIALGSVIFSRH